MHFALLETLCLRIASLYLDDGQVSEASVAGVVFERVGGGDTGKVGRAERNLLPGVGGACMH